MKKLIVLFALFAAIICLNARDVKIGIIIPLTGNLSDVGQDTRDAMLLYMREHPEAAKQIKLVFEDDQSLPKYASAAAMKLATIDKVDGLISFFGYGGSAVAPVAESHHILHFGITHDRDVTKGPYSYAAFASTDSTARLMAETLFVLGYKKVALEVSRSQGPLKTCESLKNYLKEKNIGVFEVSTLTSERDLRPVILKLKEQNCDIWITADLPPVSDIFLRQRKELGVTTPITSIWSFDNLTDTNLAERRWFISSSPLSEAFLRNFKNANHKVSPFVIYGYDNLGILAEALLNNNGDAGKTRVYLDSLKSFKGLAGDYKIYPDGFFEAPAALVIVDHGKTRETTLEEIRKLGKN